jgi:hypothetical protein
MMIPSLLQNKVNPSKRIMSSYSGCSFLLLALQDAIDLNGRAAVRLD